MTLFRNEVVDRQHRFYGDILIAMPPSLSRLVWIAALVGALIVAFCVVGEFSKKEKVQGILLPEGGIVDVFSSESGVISQRLVEEGETVTQGQSLYVISTESNNLTDGGVRHYMGTLLEQDVERKQQQLAVNASISAQKQQALRLEIRNLETKAAVYQKVNSIKRQQLKLARETLAAFTTDSREKVIGKIELRERRSRMLSLESELQELALQMEEIAYKKTQKQAEIAQLDNQLALEKSQLQSQISNVQQQLASNNAQRETVIQAPIDGKVSAVGVYQGTVAPNTVLLSIEPEGKPLQAILFVPGRAIGFMKPGQPVRLQYDAFSYQKFGQYLGVIDSISTTTVAVDDLKYLPEPKDKTQQSPFVYLVKVTLESQTVDVYGEQKRLRAGMNLEASIEVESRKIYQWLLDPFKQMQAYI